MSILLYVKASLLSYFKLKNHAVLKCGKSVTQFEDPVPQSTYPKCFVQVGDMWRECQKEELFRKGLRKFQK